ncbi:MAG: C-terminal binding protein [Candidatus Humimicrobiaceae bacterium]
MNEKKFKVVFTDYDYPDIEIEKNILSEIDCEIVSVQAKSEEQLIEACKDADALIVQYALITQKVIAKMTNCKIISRYGIGVDTIDWKYAKEKGIFVCNVPDYCTDEVADHSLALIVSLGRKIVQLSNAVKSGTWDVLIGKPIFNFKRQTLGLIGFGKIPQSLSLKAKNLFKEILVFDPFISQDTADKFGVKISTFYEILRTCDFISIHCPSNESTRHMFSLREFQLMKPGAYIINTARGAIINISDLYLALSQGLIAGAGLDVLEKEPPGIDFEMAKMENVIITPHAGFYSESAFEDLRHKAALNVLHVLKGEKPLNLVS